MANGDDDTYKVRAMSEGSVEIGKSLGVGLKQFANPLECDPNCLWMLMPKKQEYYG